MRPPLRLSVLVLFAVLISATGCEQVDRAVGGKPESRGPIPEILVVMDSTTWNGVAGDAIRAELAQPIVTLPNQQAAFKLVQLPLNNQTFARIKVQRNVVFAAPVDEDSPVGRFIRARVDSAGRDLVREERAVGINVRPDLWSANQLVVIATGSSEENLAEQFRERGAELRAGFNELARKNTETEMFSRMRQTELEDSLLQKHGFTVKVQHDYIVAQDTVASVAGRSGEFVRLRRVLSGNWRDFFLFSQDGVSELPSADELNRLTDGLLESFVLGSYDSSFVQVDFQRPVRNDTVSIAGNSALETRGMWYMTNDLMGGPFVRYAFISDNRLIVYYGMVFSPDRTIDKREIFRQMEVIGHTFRTSAAPSPS